MEVRMALIERSWLAASYLQTRCGTALQHVRVGWAGQSTVEYALVGALVVIASAVALTALGSEITTVFSRITGTLAGH
jgi:Flp pilus assembly pilin Flp